MSTYPPPVPLVYAPDIVAAAGGDAEGAAFLARFPPERRAQIVEFSNGDSPTAPGRHMGPFPGMVAP